VQSIRDAYYVAANFTQGKRNVSDYIKGSFALVGIAAAAVPVIGGLARAYRRAGEAVTLARSEISLAREATQVVGRQLDGLPQVEGAVARILSGPDEEAKAALQYLFGVCSVRVASIRPSGIAGCLTESEETLQLFNRYAPGIGEARFAKVLGRAAAESGVASRELQFLAVRNAMRNIHLAQTFYPGALVGLSDQAIEGLVRFSFHTKSSRRLTRMFKELVEVNSKTVGEASALIDRLLRNVKIGHDRLEEAVRAVPETIGAELRNGWHSFLARGAGTSATFRSTQGMNHQLEDMLRKDWRNFRAIDQLVDGYPAGGRLDLLEVRPGVNAGPLDRVHSEYKAVARLSDRDVAQLAAYIDAAIDRLGGGVRDIDAARLANQLPEYVFRGVDPSAQAALRQQLFQEISTRLPADLRGAAASVAARARFSGTYPF
jgi:hypothetical protein